MIDPHGLTVTEWTDGVILSVGDAWSIPRLDNALQWQDWGVSLVRAFAPRAVPNPYEFDDWREWAMRAYPMLEVVT